MGPAGPQGEPGLPGEAGPPGLPGATGAPGSRVLLTPIPPGGVCAAGGTRVDVGIDANGNGQLDATEVQQTANVCNGVVDAGTPNAIDGGAAGAGTGGAGGAGTGGAGGSGATDAGAGGSSGAGDGGAPASGGADAGAGGSSGAGGGGGSGGGGVLPTYGLSVQVSSIGIPIAATVVYTDLNGVQSSHSCIDYYSASGLGRNATYTYGCGVDVAAGTTADITTGGTLTFQYSVTPTSSGDSCASESGGAHCTIIMDAAKFLMIDWFQ